MASNVAIVRTAQCCICQFCPSHVGASWEIEFGGVHCVYELTVQWITGQDEGI